MFSAADETKNDETVIMTTEQTVSAEADNANTPPTDGWYNSSGKTWCFYEDGKKLPAGKRLKANGITSNPLVVRICGLTE